MQFNEYLKQCREKNHLTQEELIHDLYSFDMNNFSSIETTTVSKWERGAAKPHVSRQVSIIKYFQDKTDTALPCWEDYTVEETEEQICKAGMRNLIGKSKKLIYDFPSEMMSVDDTKVYPLRNSERMEALIDTNMPLHQSLNHQFAQIDREQFRKWALHSSSLFLACEHKGAFLGLFFAIKIKPEIFDKILDFEMKKNDITVDDFASSDEEGSSLMLSFFAMNDKTATLLFIRYYAHLIANQKTIDGVGVITIQEGAAKIVRKMNLHYDGSKVTDDNVKIKSFRQTLPNLLACESAVKMLLSKQECPEE